MLDQYKDIKYIDTHAHVFLDDFDKDRKDVLEKAGEAGVKKIYMPNLNHASIDKMLETEMQYPDICIPVMGLHPCYINKGFEKELYLIEEWLNKKRFAAIGEVGIDLYWDTTFKSQQEEALKIQIGFAEKHGLPLIIHCRNSLHETIGLIKSTDTKCGGIFHCFSGTAEEAEEIIGMGFFLGIGGVVTFKNGGLDKILPKLDLKHLVLETDSPYLTPAPFRKERNDPSYLPLIAEKIAIVMNSSVAEVAEITSRNAFGIFNRK
jgi:TatD DNase family protein